ncbi:hypothetical protein [Micromonospora sp. LOL_023]|uniref:Rv0361 family membrane protein n=1 Tax=Micromonospora sp. LOL_023 TaxID=3345418 RepID=UPI003A83E2AA
MTPRLSPLSGQPTRHLAMTSGVLALSGCTMATVAWLFLGAVQPPEAAASTAVATFASRLADGTPDSAYDLLCAATRTELDRSDFAGWARRQALADHWVGAAVVGADRTSVTVGARLTGADGTAQAVSFEVIAEQGTWRVCTGPWPR